MNKHLKLLPLAACMLCFAIYAKDETIQKAIRISREYKTLKASFSCAIDEGKYQAKRILSMVEGTFEFKQPDLFVERYVETHDDPSRNMMYLRSYDGESLDVYNKGVDEPDTYRVLRTRESMLTKWIPDKMKEFFHIAPEWKRMQGYPIVNPLSLFKDIDLERIGSVRETSLDGLDTYMIIFIPGQREDMIDYAWKQEIKAWIGKQDGLLRKIQLFHENGNIIDVDCSLHNIVLQEKIPNANFQPFDPKQFTFIEASTLPLHSKLFQ